MLDFSFYRRGLLRDHNSPPGLRELMKLTDTALRNLWSKDVHVLAPIIGKVGYLEGVSEKAEYVDVVADSILRVAARSGNEELRRAVGELEDGAGGVGRRTWRVLLDVLKGKKGAAGSSLKSLVETGGRASESKEEEEGGGIEDSLLFDEGIAKWGSEDEDGDIFLEETDTEDEGRLFTWSDDDNVDSMFSWADEDGYHEDEVSLFEELEDPVMSIGYDWDDKNNLSLFEELEGFSMGMGYDGDGKNELLFTEDEELMLEDTALARSEGEDMIWI